jgi:hypothetical protein
MVAQLRDRTTRVSPKPPTFRRRIVRIITGVALVVGGLASRLSAQAGAADRCPDPAATVHPDAPPETSQFSFLIGRWDVEVTKPDETGSWGGEPRRAYWEGRYILDGFAIADFWYDHPPDAEPDSHRGVNVRMFNRATGIWDITWQHTEDPLLVLTGEAKGDTMVVSGESPDGSLIRIVFSNIRFQSWDWQMDQSTDQGASWAPTMRIRVERMAC